MAPNEPILSRRKVIVGSDRNFGVVFAVAFTLIGVLPSLHGGEIRWWALVVATAFAICAFLVPRVLQPLNRVWFRFGLVLHHVVNPLVMGLIYYGAVVPMGFLIKALGKDLLRLKREPEAASYWIAREAPAPPPGSMAKQF